MDITNIAVARVRREMAASQKTTDSFDAAWEAVENAVTLDEFLEATAQMDALADEMETLANANSANNHAALREQALTLALNQQGKNHDY